MTNGTKDSPQRRKRPIITAVVVLILFLFLLLIAAIVFPEPILRYVFSRIEAQSGTAITFDRAYFYLGEGSILAIDGLALRRENQHGDNFNLRAESVQMPAMVPDDFRSPVLLVSGLRGTYERIGSEENSDDQTEQDAINVHALMLLDAEVNFIDRTPAKPFQATVLIEKFSVTNTKKRSLLEPYTCEAIGQIDSARFTVGSAENDQYKIEIAGVPIGLFAPYAPVLDDIFDSGSMNIRIDDLTDRTQKKMRMTIALLPDCRIKPANEILAPAIQAALQKLDQSSLPDLHDLRGKIERLKASSENITAELDKVAKIIDTLKVLAPRDVRESYEKFKNEYERVKAVSDSWETLLHDLDQVKVNIVNDTFQHFIASGVPIEIELQEVDGEWQYDGYDVVARLVETNYKAVIASQYERRIQEIRDAVDRMLAF